MRAERLRQECARCASWWQEELSEQALAAVDTGVGEALEGFEAPRGRRSVGGNSLLIAASAVLAAGILVFSADSVHEVADTSVAPDSVESSASSSDPDLILAAGFEAASGGQPSEWIVQVGAENRAEPGVDEVDPDSIFQSGLEAGGLSGWNDHS
jgi:hypothetical protein